MNTIELKHVCIRGTYDFELTGKARQVVGYVNAAFESGKVYGLIGELVFGAPAISWCIAGRIRPYEGTVLVDGKEATRHILRGISHRVWVDPREHSRRRRTVGDLITESLKKSGVDLSLKDLVQILGLERLDRPLRQCSGERWRASIAVGLSRGKSVFCFPWLWYDFVNTYRDIWMAHVFDFLRQNRCLVLVPTANAEIGQVCDEVMSFR